jgi:hypothetical protein
VAHARVLDAPQFRRKPVASIWPGYIDQEDYMARALVLRRAAARIAFGAVACAPLALLTACGGGGGGGGDGGTPVTSSAVVITSANAKPVTADALSAATTAEAAQGGSALVTGVQVQAGDTAGSLQFAYAVLTLAGKAPASRPLVQATTIHQTEPCALGGSITVSGNVAGSNGLAAGDSISVSASSCQESVDGQVSTMSGSIAIVVTAGGLGSAGAYPRDLTLAVTATNFSVSAGGETDVTNGDMTMRVHEDSSTVSSLTLSGNALANSITTAGGTRSYTQRNYAQTVAFNGTMTTYTFSSDIETNNTRLASTPVTYSVRTPSALVTSAAGDYTAGSISVTGRGSALLATVTATNTFQIQLDTNGDGSFDATVTATATELRSLF